MVDITLLIYTLNKEIQNELAPFLKEKKISYSEGQILLFLKEEGSPSQDYLVSRLNIKKSLVSQIISDLSEKKLIISTKDQKDKRLNILKLSEEGRNIANSFSELISRFSELLLSNISDYNKVNIDFLLRELIYTIKRDDS